MLRKEGYINLMKKNLFALLSLVSAFSLLSCGTNNSSLASSSSSQLSNSASSSTQDVSASASSTSSASESYVKAWVSDVSGTASIMIAGQYEGTDVDYVVSSYPVVANALAKNTKLSVKEDLGAAFGTKYGTDGFPQAGLFIKNSLSTDSSKNDSVDQFLNTFDASINDLISGGSEAIANMKAYGTDDEQTARFGFKSAVLNLCQKDSGNKLAFISKAKNPDVAGFDKFTSPLGFSVTDSLLSSHYPTKSTSTLTTKATTLDYKVVCPSGAPAAAFSQFASGTNLTITSPANVKAALAKGEADFIMFDSVNGLNAIKSQSYGYSLVRMVTFGNLYLVATGNDDNATFEKSDYTVAYGETLIPGKVFKSIYQD